MRPLYICLATDDNYVPLATVSIASIIDSNYDSNIEFFILDSGISNKNKSLLKKIVNNGVNKISFIDVSSNLQKLIELGVNSQGINHSYAAYARFFIIEYLPEYVDKLLYVDCDTCICDSLNKLFNIDLSNFVLGAVLDILPDFHKKNIGFISSDYYFNSGVLLFNCKEWRKENIVLKIFEHLKNINSKYSFHDQDLINIVCKNKIKILPPEYMVFLPEYSWGAKKLNILTKLRKDKYYTTEELLQASENPVIIHYVDGIFGRPWYFNNKGKYDYIWKKYLKLTNLENSFPYKEKKRSLLNKCLINSYYILPKILFIKIYSIRKNRVLRKREELI